MALYMVSLHRIDAELLTLIILGFLGIIVTFK